jgi:hypothetical protein
MGINFKIFLQKINFKNLIFLYSDPNYDLNTTGWIEFKKQNEFVLNINSSIPMSDKTLIADWLDVHKFWYEILPNNLYEECLNEYTSSSGSLINCRYFSIFYNYFSIFIILIISK